MLKLIPRRRRRVSNGLAIFAAFLLAASLLASTGQTLQDTDRQTDARAQPADLQSDSNDLAAQSSTGKTRKFRISLFLFRN